MWLSPTWLCWITVHVPRASVRVTKQPREVSKQPQHFIQEGGSDGSVGSSQTPLRTRKDKEQERGLDVQRGC